MKKQRWAGKANIGFETDLRRSYSLPRHRKTDVQISTFTEGADPLKLPLYFSSSLGDLRFSYASFQVGLMIADGVH